MLLRLKFIKYLQFYFRKVSCTLQQTFRKQGKSVAHLQGTFRKQGKSVAPLQETFRKLRKVVAPLQKVSGDSPKRHCNTARNFREIGD